EEPHGANAQVLQNLNANAVVALIRFEAEPLVCLDRVEPLVLKLVRANLVGEPDSAPLLVQVQQHPSPLGCNATHRRVELRTAIAARRVEDVARQAARVHAHEHTFTVAEIAL